MVPRIVDSEDHTRETAAATVSATLNLQALIFADVVAHHQIDLQAANDEIARIQSARPADISGTGVQYQDTIFIADTEKKFSSGT